jgi:hypothetical protein
MFCPGLTWAMMLNLKSLMVMVAAGVVACAAAEAVERVEAVGCWLALGVLAVVVLLELHAVSRPASRSSVPRTL